MYEGCAMYEGCSTHEGCSMLTARGWDSHPGPGPVGLARRAACAAVARFAAGATRPAAGGGGGVHRRGGSVPTGWQAQIIAPSLSRM
jgi:hypothetical protein